MAAGWHEAGRSGAEAYLGAYGRGLGAAKAIALALCADAHSAREMAARFWEEAFFDAYSTALNKHTKTQK